MTEVRDQTTRVFQRTRLTVLDDDLYARLHRSKVKYRVQMLDYKYIIETHKCRTLWNSVESDE
jgi:hypothetical protein